LGKSPYRKPSYIQKFNFYSKKNFLQILAQLAMPPAGLFGLSAYAARAPPPPPLTPSCHEAPNGHPPITPPLQSAVFTPSFTLGNGSDVGANYRRRPPFVAAHSPSRPYKRAPTLQWSTLPPSPHLLPSSFEHAP
jgi:hypothetical protein